MTFRVWLTRAGSARVALVTAEAADELPAAVEEQVPGSWELQVAVLLTRQDREEEA
jgi:hypothetical protein